MKWYVYMIGNSDYLIIKVCLYPSLSSLHLLVCFTRPLSFKTRMAHCHKTVENLDYNFYAISSRSLESSTKHPLPGQNQVMETQNQRKQFRANSYFQIKSI